MKKKIVHIVEAFGGGVFSILEDLINRTSEDYNITILYGKRTETPENIERYFNDNVKLVEIKNFTKQISFIKDIKAIFEVKEHIKQINPNIVHLHSSKAGAIGRIACKDIRTLYSPHCFAFMQKDISKIKKKLYFLIEKIMASRKTCSIIACSKEEYEIAKKLTSNAILIENGIDLEKIEECLKNKKNTTKKNTICTAGRIAFQKNPELFNAIAEKLPEYEFTWIGEGKLRNVLTAPNIKITGWLAHNEVIRRINENEVFLLTSKVEGLPIALLEALFLEKKCIISSDIQSMGVIKDCENGFIAHNVNDYIKYIKNIEQNKITKDVYEKIKNEYNMDTYTQKYKQLIENKNTKKVILFTEKFNDGGIEKIIANIFLNFNKKQYDLEILSFTRNTNLYKNIPSKILVEKTPKLKISRKLKGVFALKNYLKKNKIDILHVNLYNAVGLIYAKIAFKAGVRKIIVHAHNSGIDNDPFKIKKAMNYLIKKAFSNNKYIYISASKQCENFCFKSNIESVIIPNEINADEYAFNEIIRKEYRKKFGFKENDIVIGNVGRFEKQKNHKLLVNIFEKVHIQNVNTYQVASLPIICRDTIPKEVIKTEKIHTVSIEDKPQNWTKLILNCNTTVRAKNQVHCSTIEYVKKIEKIYKYRFKIDMSQVN